jgi:hypothetical protein
MSGLQWIDDHKEFYDKSFIFSWVLGRTYQARARVGTIPYHLETEETKLDMNVMLFT